MRTRGKRRLLSPFTNAAHREFADLFGLVKYIMFMGMLGQTIVAEMKVVFIIPGFGIDGPYRQGIISFKKSAFHPARWNQVQQGIAEEGTFRECDAEIILDPGGIIL